MGSIFATLVILATIERFDVPVTLRDRMGAISHDLLGMTTSYLPLMALAFLVAMPGAVLLGRYLDRLRFALYGAAGFAAVICLHLAMQAVLGLNGIAAVRELHGLLLQGIAGWFGGYLFYLAMGQAHR